MLSFDIYLKGNVSKATSFFKNPGHGPRFRMFPYVEKKRRVDDYGETVDVGMWLRKGRALEEEAESEEVKDYKRKAAEEESKVLSVFNTSTLSFIILLENHQRTSLQICIERSRNPACMSTTFYRHGW